MVLPRVTAIIPAHNEEKYIGSTINTLKNINIIKQIIVIDDGSEDLTRDIAVKEGVEVVTLSNNLGKGGAINYAADFIKEDIVALVDADLGETAIEISKLINPVVNQATDIAVAIFPPAKKRGGLGIVKNLANFGIKIKTKRKFLAPLSGQRVMSKRVFFNLLPLARGFGLEVGMTIDAVRKGYKILEVKTNMQHAETGRNLRGFVHRGRQFKDILLLIIWKG